MEENKNNSLESKADGILAELDKLLQNESPELRTHVLRVVRSVETSYSGPLPKPDDFAKYESVQKGAADRILTMAEKQQEHRIECEKMIVSKNLRKDQQGQYIGALIALVCISASVALGLLGHDTLGGIIGGATLLGAIVVFVLNKEPQENK